MNASTVEERHKHFVDVAAHVHGTTYDYSQVVYVNSATKVCIVCSDHGPFYMRPNNHTSGQGCPACAVDKQLRGVKTRNAKCKESFIDRARKTYGDRYDYSNTVYTRSTDPIEVVCNHHGSFTIKYAWEHLAGKRHCPVCAQREKREKLQAANTLSSAEYIRRATEVHGGWYTYDRTVYTGCNNPVVITCPDHGDFVVARGGEHVYGFQGCQACTRKMSKCEQLIENALHCRNVRFIYQHTFPDLISTASSKRLAYDFYLVDLNVLIEYDGEQHTKHVPFFHTNEEFARQRANDAAKDKYAADNNMMLYRISYEDRDDIDDVVSLLLEKEIGEIK